MFSFFVTAHYCAYSRPARALLDLRDYHERQISVTAASTRVWDESGRFSVRPQ